MWKRVVASVTAIAVLSFFGDIEYARAALPETASFPQSGSISSRWKLNEASGTRADSVGSNTLADNNTVASAAGQFDETAADFESTASEYLSISDASQSGLDITGDLTFAAWVNFESTGTMGIFSKVETAGNNRSYYLYLLTGNSLSFGSYTNGTGASGTTSTVSWTPSTATWYHIIMVYDASEGEVKFFVDGVQQGSTQTGHGTSIYNGAAPFHIGAWSTTDFLDAKVQDAIIWSAELSDAESLSTYNAYFSSGGGMTLPIIIIFYSDVNTYA